MDDRKETYKTEIKIDQFEGKAAASTNQNMYDEEQAIEYNCKFVSKFLSELRVSNFGIMSSKSKDHIKAMSNEMLDFVKFHDGAIKRPVVTEKMTQSNQQPSKNAKDEMIPNLKGKTIGKDSLKSDSDDTDSSSKPESDSDERSVAVRSDSSRKSRSRAKRKDRSGSNVDDTLWQILAERLDNRKVPEHRKFEEGRGESLEEFLVSFEKYCRKTFRGEDEVVSSELERYLTGETLKAFKGLVEINDSFDEVKKKLLTWDKDMQDRRKKNAKSKFNKASFESGETLHLYSTRLERLFKSAYPKHKNIERSSRLIEKYLDTVPDYAKQEFRSIYQYEKLKGNEMGWPMVQRAALLKDVQLEDKKANESETEEIVISVNKTKQTNDNDKSDKNQVQYKQEKKQFQYQNQRNNNPNMNFVTPIPNANHMQNAQQAPRQHYNQNQQQQVNRFSAPRMQYIPFSLLQHLNNQFNSQHNPRFSAPRNFNNRFSSPYNPRFSAPNGEESRFCNFCQRFGHLDQNCRSRPRNCYCCGQLGHISVNCPLNFNNRNNRSQSQPPRQGGYQQQYNNQRNQSQDRGNTQQNRNTNQQMQSNSNYQNQSNNDQNRNRLN